MYVGSIRGIYAIRFDGGLFYRHRRTWNLCGKEAFGEEKRAGRGLIRSVRQGSGSIKQKWFSSVRTMSDRLRNSGCGMIMMRQEMRFHSAPFTLRAGIYRNSRRIKH